MSMEDPVKPRKHTAAEFTFIDVSNGILPIELRDLSDSQARALSQLIDDILTIVQTREDQTSALDDARDKIERLKEKCDEITQENQDLERNYIYKLNQLAALLSVDVSNAESTDDVIGLIRAEIERLLDVMRALRTIGAYILKNKT